MLKRTGFKKKPRTPLKRTALSSQNRTTRSKIDSKGVKRPKAKSGNKATAKGYKPPKWFTSLKPGSHGNTPAQKKYWKVVSDTYRLEDFEKYGGKCVSCPVRFERWQDGQLGHWKAWNVCNAWFKYERKNLALQCGGCNRRSDGPTNENFKQELKRRHGKNVITWIEAENLKYRNQKMEVWELVERTAALLGKSANNAQSYLLE
jgi:hypothetical protein